MNKLSSRENLTVSSGPAFRCCETSCHIIIITRNSQYVILFSFTLSWSRSQWLTWFCQCNQCYTTNFIILTALLTYCQSVVLKKFPPGSNRIIKVSCWRVWSVFNMILPFVTLPCRMSDSHTFCHFEVFIHSREHKTSLKWCRNYQNWKKSADKVFMIQSLATSGCISKTPFDNNF